MASKIAKDSGLNIFVKEIPCASSVHTNDWVVSGAKRGLAGIDARLGEDGNYYTTVDTAALIRSDANTIAFTDGGPVYVTSGGAFNGTASANTLIGYADRAKTTTSGPLFIQLVPASV